MILNDSKVKIGRNSRYKHQIHVKSKRVLRHKKLRCWSSHNIWGPTGCHSCHFKGCKSFQLMRNSAQYDCEDCHHSIISYHITSLSSYRLITCSNTDSTSSAFARLCKKSSSAAALFPINSQSCTRQFSPTFTDTYDGFAHLGLYHDAGPFHHLVSSPSIYKKIVLEMAKLSCSPATLNYDTQSRNQQVVCIVGICPSPYRISARPGGSRPKTQLKTY